jgi:hypothetical protein
MAGAFVMPGAHPIAGNYGPNLKATVPLVPHPATMYTSGAEVNMVNHTDTTSDIVSKRNIPLEDGGHVAATAPQTGRTGKHLARW